MNICPTYLIFNEVFKLWMIKENIRNVGQHTLLYSLACLDVI